MRKKQLSVTLTLFEMELLKELAIEKDRSLSYMVGHAIETFAYHGAMEGGEWGAANLDSKILERIEKKHFIEKEG